MYRRELCAQCKRNAEVQGQAKARYILRCLCGPSRPDWRELDTIMGNESEMVRNCDACDSAQQRGVIELIAAATYAEEVELLRRRGKVLCLECTYHARGQASEWVNREMNGGPRPIWGLTDAHVTPNMLRDCCDTDLQRREINTVAEDKMAWEWDYYDDD